MGQVLKLLPALVSIRPESHRILAYAPEHSHGIRLVHRVHHIEVHIERHRGIGHQGIGGLGPVRDRLIGENRLLEDRTVQKQDHIRLQVHYQVHQSVLGGIVRIGHIGQSVEGNDGLGVEIILLQAACKALCHGRDESRITLFSVHQIGNGHRLSGEIISGSRRPAHIDGHSVA